MLPLSIKLFFDVGITLIVIQRESGKDELKVQILELKILQRVRFSTEKKTQQVIF